MCVAARQKEADDLVEFQARRAALERQRVEVSTGAVGYLAMLVGMDTVGCSLMVDRVDGAVLRSGVDRSHHRGIKAARRTLRAKSLTPQNFLMASAIAAEMAAWRARVERANSSSRLTITPASSRTAGICALFKTTNSSLR